MNKIVVCLSIIFVLLSCKKEDDTDKIETTVNLPEEYYDVYGSILYPLSSINIVVSTTDTSLNCSDFFNITNDAVGVTPQIVEKCIEINKDEFAIQKDNLLSGGLRLVSWDEIVKSESEAHIYEKYGATGMFRFGVPVFFNDGNSALFEMNRYCGPLCGNGAIVIAKKINNSWGVEYYYGTWISK